MFVLQKDMKSEPVKRVVALGESTTWGYSVSSKDKCWVNQVVTAIEEFQGTKIELINQGIGSNVLTPECPAYEYSAKPSALERVDEELIAYEPDMVFLSYGLNDSRGGTPPEVFRKAYQELIDRIQGRINPIIVLVNTYYMHEVLYDNCKNWEESSYELETTTEGTKPDYDWYYPKSGVLSGSMWSQDYLYSITARGWDGSIPKNTADSSDKEFVWDVVEPTAAITYPVANDIYGTLTQISATAYDAEKAYIGGQNPSSSYGKRQERR